MIKKTNKVVNATTNKDPKNVKPQAANAKPVSAKPSVDMSLLKLKKMENMINESFEKDEARSFEQLSSSVSGGGGVNKSIPALPITKPTIPPSIADLGARNVQPPPPTTTTGAPVRTPPLKPPNPSTMSR